MITVYKNKKDIKSDELIEYVDLKFNALSYSLEINDLDKKYIKEIDNAVYTGNGMITTPFGVTSIRNISTGCKTLILLNHFGNEKVISIQECGGNVMNIIFNKMKNKRVYLNHTVYPTEYDPNILIEYYSNGKIIKIPLYKFFEQKLN